MADADEQKGIENLVYITIYGAFSKIEGDFPKEEVYAVCSYKGVGVEYSKAYKKGLWDGYTYLINRKTNSFPSGLVNIVKQVCEEQGKEVILLDHRQDPGSMGIWGKGSFDLNGISMTGKYSYQLEACEIAVEKKQGILSCATGCHRKGQKILRFDGSVALVEELKIGDLLLGPDSNPREILELRRGHGRMCKIIPTKGNPFVVNEDHVLSLISTNRYSKGHKYYKDPIIVDVTVNEWKSWTKTQKHLFKLFKVNGVEFGSKKEKLIIPSYHLGVLLGDGGLSSGSTRVYKPDVEIRTVCEDLANIFGLTINLVDKDTSSIGYAIVGTKGKPNPLTIELKKLGLYKIKSNTKFIPKSYLLSSYNDRLDLLAGLLDTDGSYDGKGFDYITASKQLGEDVEYLAKSLGFSAYLVSCKKKCQTGKEGVYYRCSINGFIENIPTRIFRKKANPRKQKKNVLYTGFRVEDILETEDYYGFILDGDHRYLLDDFTVTHNSGKTEIFSAIISYLQLPTLFIVPSKELLYQTRDRFLERIPNLKEKDLGIIGDNKWSVGSFITIAIIDTLESKSNTIECKNLFDNTDVLIVDEVHNAGSASYYDILSACNAYYRFGGSGTALDRTDGANLKIIALFGDVIHKITNKQLVELKVLPKAKIIFDKVTKPSLVGKKIKYKEAYDLGIVNNIYLTNKIVEWTKICVDQGLSVLIMVEHIKHGKLIDEALWNVDGSFIPHTFISGQVDDKKNRKEGFEAFDKREIPVLISSNILNTGVSSKAIDVLIPIYRESKIRTIQGLGRTLRGDKAIVIEFANYTNKYLLKHSLARLRDYKAEDCFDIVQSGPDAELIKRLWAGGSK